ncbi:MAG: acetate--CoA ligase family protein [Desulfobacterales bacterium]|nr:acetate--CoA ligase family protein [Desulfobacterales bacterium]
MTLSQSIIEQAIKNGRTSLSEVESKQFLKSYGIPVIEDRLADDENSAIEHAKIIGFPVVLKGVGPTLLHKTERNLVHLNLSTPEAVSHAAKSILEEAGDECKAFVVQPFYKGKREFVAGLFHDPHFGPVVMFGIGGILTEAIADVTFRIAPVSESDAHDMLNDIRAQTLLKAFRGDKAPDQLQIIRVIMGLSEIGMTLNTIQEIDINPLIVNHDGNICAVDALVVIGKTQENKTYPPPVNPNLLGYFFYPRSVAFIGASNRLGKWGHTLVYVVKKGGFKGQTYLVNPKGGMIAEQRVYPSLQDIDGKIDLAIVTIPAEKVIELIPQLQQKGIKAILLISSGFGESGAHGKALEKELVDLARQANMFILGPNTMGICNPHIDLYCMGVHTFPKKGSIAIVAQSGNMGTQLLIFAEQQGIGIRGFCGSGNEAMITIEDFLEAFEQDELTQTVVLYIESVKNGRRFFELAKRVGKKKPIVMLKGGRTQAGNRAAASHTGALSSDVKIFNAACRQAGIVNVNQPMDLLDLAAAFSSVPLPKGNRVAIMTLGGGWGVVTADLCSEYGLSVPDLSSDICEQIDQILPPYWSRSNPIDLVGENDNRIPMTVIELLLKWEGCDGVINLGILGRRHMLRRMSDSISESDPTYSHDFLEAINQRICDFEKKYIETIVDLMEKYQKPIFGVNLITEDDDHTVYRIEDKTYKALFFQTPERAVKSFAKMYEYYQFLNR